jgi:RNA polymerase sigma factor FliA
MTTNLAVPQTSAASTSSEREQLILEHMPQVKLIARRIHERLPESISLDDLISVGVMGLIAAIDRFDQRHDVQLKTYAEYKIRGAILDSLRGQDWAPRQQRQRVRLIQKAIATLQQEYQRVPDDQEIAGHLGLTVAVYHHWLSEAAGLTIGSLEGAGGDEEGSNLIRYLADSEQKLPSQIWERAELERSLSQAIERMPKVERTVLNLYFFEEMTLREIAKILLVHESRVSQIKTQAILRLRSFLQERRPGPKK